MNNFDIEKSNISEFESFFSDKIRRHKRPTMKLQFEGLIRMRNVTFEKLENLMNICSIWYPNWSEIPKKNHSLNRCSDIGQNFFYCSNYLEATLNEINPSNNDLVLVGVFKPKNYNIKAQAQFAGINTIKKNGRYKLLKDYTFPSVSDEKFENDISEIFQKKVTKTNESFYKQSIALSNILLKNEEINCLVYPSVASNLKFENYGLKPEFVDKYLFCNQIYLYRVSKNSNEIILTPEKLGDVKLNFKNPKYSEIIWKNVDKFEKLKYSI